MRSVNGGDFSFYQFQLRDLHAPRRGGAAQQMPWGYCPHLVNFMWDASVPYATILRQSAQSRRLTKKQQNSIAQAEFLPRAAVVSEISKGIRNIWQPQLETTCQQ